MYNAVLNSYLLSGGLRSQSGPLPNPGACSQGIIQFPNVPTGSGGTTTVTVVPASNGLYVMDLGTDSVTLAHKGAAVGTATFLNASAISNVMAGSYLGVIFKRNSTPITTLVGFGPGSGSSITGGGYSNIDSDPFSAHANNVTITLTSVNSNGFLTGTVTDANGTHSPFVAVASLSDGKYFLYGITTDTSTTTPYAIFLAQQ
jgi:hypothetical protein